MRKVTLGTTNISERGKKYVLGVLESNRLSYGPYSQKFEAEFAKIHSSKYGIICNSGTSSLMVSLAAIKELYGFEDGDEVIVPAMTFASDINVIVQNNLVPKLVDVDSRFYDLDPNVLERAISKKTKAIIPVHVFGQSANMPEIYKIAKKHNLKIIEDSCQTMFSKIKGKVVGSWGELACFSMHSAHLITTGVGGIVLTNNPELERIVRSLISHGRDERYLSLEDDDNLDADDFDLVVKNRFSFKRVGFSMKITELEAALALAQLEEFEKIIKPRKKNAAYLSKRLEYLKEFITLPGVRPGSDHVFMVYPIVIKKGVNRDQLVLFLEKRGIETRPFLPIINQPAYKFLEFKPQDYPVAQSLEEDGFYIGCHQDLKQKDLDYIVDQFSLYFG